MHADPFCHHVERKATLQTRGPDIGAELAQGAPNRQGQCLNEIAFHDLCRPKLR
jgi:hypothetical protein